MMMRNTRSTATVASSGVEDYWAEALTQLLPGLQFEPRCEAFEGEMSMDNIGGLDIVFMRAAPQTVRNASRPRLAERKFALIYLRSGYMQVQQLSRIAHVMPNQCILVDCCEDCEIVHCTQSESATLVLPASWLGQWLVTPDAQVAKLMSADMTQCRPLLEMLDLLSSGHCPETTGGQLINGVGATLALALSDDQAGTTAHTTRLYNRIQQIIWRRAGDHHFSPQAAADEAGISRRYLVTLFSAAGTTFNTELMRVRLERASLMLREGRFQSLSVIKISARCGFSDPSHFSKRFKERFGMSPAAYRQGGENDGTATNNVLTFE